MNHLPLTVQINVQNFVRTCSNVLKKGYEQASLYASRGYDDASYYASRGYKHITHYVNYGYDYASQWTQQGIQAMQKLPQHMQKDLRVAVGVFASANVLFCTVMHSIANKLDRPRKSLNLGLRAVKYIVLNAAFGASVYGFNKGLSKLTQVSLREPVLFAIAGIAVAGRVVINRISQYATNRKEEATRKKLEGTRQEIEQKIKQRRAEEQAKKTTHTQS